MRKPDEDEDRDVEQLTNARNEKYQTLSIVYETLGKAWPNDKTTQLEFQDKVLAECLQTLELSPRNVQVRLKNFTLKQFYLNFI